MTPQEQELHQQWLVQANRLIEEGDNHFDQEAYSAAHPLYQQALALRQAALGERHESVAVALNRLANVYYQQKNDREAGELFEQALAIREAVLPPHASDLRLSVNNLANAYRNQGRFAEAEPLYRRSLQMRVQETGQADHPAIWRNLVRVLEGQGKHGEAAEYVERIRAFELAHPG
jgi:tetratricopeptide (TPR) repeat protein